MWDRESDLQQWEERALHVPVMCLKQGRFWMWKKRDPHEEREREEMEA